MAEPQLVVFAGLPGTGKSSLGRAVARQRRAAYLDKDTIKDGALAVAEEMALEALAEAAGPLSYSLLVDLARDNLTLGLSVVLDSPAGYEVFRGKLRALARALKVDLRWIECVCSDEGLLRRRVEERGRSLPGHRTQDWATYQRERVRFERLLDRRLVVDTADSLPINLSKVLAYLDQPASGNTGN